MNTTNDPVLASPALGNLDMAEYAAFLDTLVRPAVAPEGVVGKNPQTAAIVLAGGSGERFGREGGKQLVEIDGRPVLTWSISAFDAVADVGAIVVVCPQERMEEYCRAAIEPFDFVTPIIVAPAGSTRQESAFSGLEYVPDEFPIVAMHDGARPLITPGLIEHALANLKGNFDADGVIVATPAVDTLKIVEDGVVAGTPDRHVFWNAQTPQIFRTGMLRRAHAAALSDGFMGTDDASLIERMGGRVLVVRGSRDNIKLTVPEDLFIMLSAVRGMYAQADGEKESEGTE